ncbi:MAG: carbohydrate ABC transporter permease [Bacteroidota bacterium]
MLQPSATYRNLITVSAWLIALLIFFPILWMFLAGFKTEIDAIASPPALLFAPTWENYIEVQSRANYLQSALNSIIISLGSTALALAIAAPAAYAFAFHPTKQTRNTLLWMLSTKMLPSVGVLVPVYLIFRDLGLLDTHIGLILINTLINLPILVWLLFSFFRDVPYEILEAGRIDGVSFVEELRHILIPLAMPGIASCALLSIILCWNEAFWSLNLTTSDAAPLTAFIASFSAPEGLFWAKLSAASTLAIAPILVIGWMSQRQLVQGLTFGAVK